MQFTRYCRDSDLVAKYAFFQAPSCTNFLPPGSASDSRTGVIGYNFWQGYTTPYCLLLLSATLYSKSP